MKERIIISQTSNADMNIGFTNQWKDTPLNIGGQTKETAIQYMIRQLRYAYDAKKAMDNELDVDDVEYFGEIALQMEKEQIIKAASVVLWNNSANSTEEAEKYYNETYGNKS